MRLLSYLDGSSSRTAAVVDDRWVVDLAAALRPGAASERCVRDLRGLLEAGDAGRAAADAAVAWARETLSIGRREPALLERASLRLAPPLPPDTAIIAMGRNFGRHLDEGNARRRALGEATVPVSERPQAFLKLGRCAVGDGAVVPYPQATTQLDYEGEVAAVIGRPARDVSTEDAMDHIAGYTILNDISARDIQRAETSGGLLLLGKNLPGSAPMGPELVLADEVPDPGALRIRTTVNGELRQDSSLADMRFGWPELVAYWSQIGLRPGDVIAGGTPAGVAFGRDDDAWYLRPGDRVTVEVDRLGSLRTTIGPAAAAQLDTRDLTNKIALIRNPISTSDTEQKV